MTSLPEFDDEKPVGLLDFIGSKPPGLLEHFRALSRSPFLRSTAAIQFSRAADVVDTRPDVLAAQPSA